jgi:ribosomal protein L44E
MARDFAMLGGRHDNVANDMSFVCWECPKYTIRRIFCTLSDHAKAQLSRRNDRRFRHAQAAYINHGRIFRAPRLEAERRLLLRANSSVEIRRKVFDLWRCAVIC